MTEINVEGAGVREILINIHGSAVSEINSAIVHCFGLMNMFINAEAENADNISLLSLLGPVNNNRRCRRRRQGRLLDFRQSLPNCIHANASTTIPTYIAYIHQNADDHIHTIIALKIFYGIVSNTHARTHDELRIVDRRKRHNIIYIHLIHTPMKMRWGLWTGSTGVMRVMFPHTNGRVIRVGLMMVEWHGNGMMMACLLALLLFEWRHESI